MNYKKMIKCLKFSISKDETRPQLCGVIHHEELKALVANNGYIITVLKSCYNEKLKNNIIDNDFQVIDREYPRVETILPVISKMNITSYQIEKKHYIKSKLPTHIYFCGDSVIKMDKCDDYLFCLDANNLKPLADNSSYEVLYNNSKNLVIFKLDDECNNYFGVMPLRGE